VSLRWTAGLLDNAPNNPIDSYWIWREVPVHKAQQALAQGATRVGEHGTALPATGRPLRTSIESGQVYYWEWVGSQVAHGFPAYSYTATTLSDSVPGSNPYTLFMVESERTSTGQYWSSNPDSGYSVDNLQPATPAPFLAAYLGGATNLHWGENTESDLAGYRLYRGSSSSFVPSPGNLVSARSDTGYADVGPSGNYYKLSAVDVHGNESAFALLTPASTTSVDPRDPLAFTLDPVSPNPVRGSSLAISFTLPRSAPAQLDLLDIAWRSVASRPIVGVGPGRQTFDLGSAAGLHPGLYWVRLRQGSATRVTRVVLLGR
jgi:hypothetical protein